ncbi:hypothetical protein SAY86_018729 [Trapa natans]|uniref:Fatty acyl-CoA reductase n=1 Tax=Trapa natans TaxID=22666 RepID=A0AAN7LDS3_TRANT|nr:hypothetical protein SAY86_018729 [Trapa natans]
MSSISQSIVLSLVPSRPYLKLSCSLPPTASNNIKCQLSSARLDICGSLRNHVVVKFASNYNSTSTRGLSACAGNMAVTSTFLDHDSHRGDGTFVPSASASSVMTPAIVAPDAANDTTEGVGILKFLEGKSYFITGATGLLAKALVEKILREAPNTGKIFLLVKAKDKEDALNRIKSEIVQCGLFKRLEELHGDNYTAFMMSKLVPVVGNMCEPNLGISDNELAARMFEEVDVIVNSAANTNFDERYDVALNINTQGPFRLLSFAMRCKKLQNFLHVSTAYVNGERQGVVKEKPFYMGQSIAEEKATIASGTDDKQYLSLPQLDVHAEIKLASQMVKDLTKDEADRKMRMLGLDRARMFGWQDTYVFTKAMGEMMIASYKGHIPITIIRPSIIESTYREPLPGWIQGNRMVDPVLLSYGKGLLPGYFADPQGPVDIVPLDMVVNTMVSAMAKHGRQRDLALNVYQIASSVINPLKVGEMFQFSCDHFESFPLKDSRDEAVVIKKMKFFSSLDEFSAYIQYEVSQKMGLRGEEAASTNPRTLGKLQVICKRTVENLVHMAKLYEPYAFYKGWFHNGNTQKLMAEMSPDELEIFPLDLKNINWKNYFMNIHIPGLKRSLLKGGR